MFQTKLALHFKLKITLSIVQPERNNRKMDEEAASFSEPLSLTFSTSTFDSSKSSSSVKFRLFGSTSLSLLCEISALLQHIALPSTTEAAFRYPFVAK